MTILSTSAQSNLDKFQDLLRELFQFDCADLDFGIYRIMNHKRDAIEQFIRERLPAIVAEELDRGPLAQQARAEDNLAEVAQRVKANLGEDAIDGHGVLHPPETELPIVRELVKEYEEAQRQAADVSRSRNAVEAAIYNHLHTFFSRYYEEGDFITKRRYSRSRRYAIPYNGEEVYLHWANSDQYYVKTDEHFCNYDWKAPNGVSVHFRLKSADVEQNNVKGDRRFFIPRFSGTEWDADDIAITIPFEYRPLSGSETTAYGSRNQQDKIIGEAVAKIPERLPYNAPAIAALTGEHRRNGDGPVSRLEHHLRRYVGRNNSDFFIHKDLSGFLYRELDFYLKNEVLNLDSLVAAGQDLTEGWFQQIRLTKAVGSHIIDFLAQIEDFQKLLWEKRKLVIETHYCITLSNISADLYPEIIKNEAQWQEWKELYGLEISKPSTNLLAQHPTLVVDTRHFDTGFTDCLLASFNDLDKMTDGVLVHGDNWQALNFLAQAYQEQIQCVYIDPPFNSKSTEILYKNQYKHSSWLSLIENRLKATYQLLGKSSVLTIAIDENEQERLALLLGYLFPNHQRTCVSVVHNPGGIQGDNFSYNNEFAYFVYPSGSRSVGMQNRDDSPDVRPLRDVSTGQHLRTDAANCFYPIYVKGKEVIGFGAVCDEDFHPGSANVDTGKEVIAVYPIDAQGVERKWVFSRQNVERIKDELTVQWNKSRKIWDIIRRKSIFNYKTVWDDRRYNANSHGSKLISDLFGFRAFSFPKSLYTVMDSVQLATDAGSGTKNVLDFFAGSGTTGHAVISLNRKDGGERKFILVEMGEYFDTVLLPRIKKVTYTPEWKNGNPQGTATTEEAERSPRIVKCIRLESYEDALDSIRFDQDDGQLSLPDAGDEYLLKYMLSWETKESETLLNPALLNRPFTYKLRVHVNGEQQERKVDLPETFNYLLGLNVRKRETYDDNGQRYLVYRGETRHAPGRKVAAIWRETEGWTEADFARDRDFVDQHAIAGDAETVYVNGDSCIPRAKPIEPMFKARMFASVSN